jgi:uncharacterized iron-regulated membrane protein
MINLSKIPARRLTDIHGWAGVIFGLALYVVILSGAIVVFSHEIGAWSVSGHKLGDGLQGQIDQRLVELGEDLPPEYKDEVGLWQNSSGELIAFFHTHIKNEEGKISEKGTRFVLDPTTLDIISQVEGFDDDLPAVTSGFLEQFLVTLHIKLHAPDPIGLYLTGILGLVLLVSAVSGFIIHRHLIKDIFLSPRLNTRLLNTRDRHNLAGTWGMVFSIILAFTGAFFSFASTLGLPVIAMTAFGGDQEKALIAIYGEPAVVDPTPQKFTGIEAIIEQSKQANIAGSAPVFVFIEHWGRADATVSTTHSPNDDNLFYTTHKFNGVTGNYMGEKPRVGNQPSAGSALLGMMGVLHFGWFAGLFSRIIWLSLGLATCYVTITGLQLWVQRREKEASWQGLAKLIPTVGYGLPIAMVTAAIGFIVTYLHQTERVETWTINGFLIGVVLSFIIGLSLNTADKSKQVLQRLLGAGLILLPVLRAYSHQTIMGDASVVALDISLILSGVLLFIVSKKPKLDFIKDNAKSNKINTARGAHDY